MSLVELSWVLNQSAKLIWVIYFEIISEIVKNFVKCYDVYRNGVDERESHDSDCTAGSEAEDIAGTTKF